MKIQSSKGLFDAVTELIAKIQKQTEISKVMLRKLEKNNARLPDGWKLFCREMEKQGENPVNAVSEILHGKIQELFNTSLSLEDLSRRIVIITALCNGELPKLAGDADYFARLVYGVQTFSMEDVKADPYYQNIQLPEAKEGRFHILNQKMPKNMVFLRDNFQYSNNGYAVPIIGVLDETVPAPVLLEGKDEAWMSIDFHEICTMQEGIEKAHGKVLTLGCGLGYYAYCAALKDNVESVTIIEKEPDVIRLFQKHILPQMNTSKITVIQADAFEYMENLKDGTFDFCYADIWDGITGYHTYLRLRAICNRFSKTDMNYWLGPNLERYLYESFLVWVINRAMGAICRETKELSPWQPLPDTGNLFPLWSAMHRKTVLSNRGQLQALTDPKHLQDLLHSKKLGKYLKETEQQTG